ncbi:MAG: cupin 2 domain-containing protein [Ignavibacteria bacterium]|nr:MAG: cupin 2 domain-containing protein [Ignavibacteria bacterium]KAF0160794.1 MAG: cupin 2 domain-containing protein [Ignavibacteria bacterium]
MKHFFKIFSLLLILAASLNFAQELKLEPKVIVPADVKWTVAANGIRTSVLYGDPATPGFYIMFVIIPDGLKLPPHFHPETRTVVVVSGKFYYGYGSTFDESKVYEMPQGTYFTEPSNQHHYAYAKTGEVLLYIRGFCPTGTTYVEQAGK